jgi:hypothetical protein
MQWIKCSERMPEKEGHYLTVTKDAMRMTLCASWFSAKSNQFQYKELYPTHWAELPAPPEAE